MSTLKVNTIDSHSGSTLTIDSTADVSVASTTSATSSTTGALKVAGGISTQENLYVGGNAVITGTMTANGGTITLGDADTDNVSFGGEVNSDVLPNTSNTFDLGSSSKKWAEVHATTVTADLTGDVTGNVTGNTSGSAGSCTGNAATATALETARTIGLSGDVSGSVSFDGSANATITATVANDSHDHTDKAPLASPALTGTPTAPTAAANTNNTQIATTAYVQTEITDLIGGAPGALDTLNELAAAIDDDSSYASTVTTALGGKVGTSSAQALSSAANALTISGTTITLARGDSTTDTISIPEGYTDSDVDAHLSGGTGVTYSSGVISIGQAVATTSNVTFNDVTVSGTLTETSAAIYKENINPLTSQLDNIMQLNPVEYDKKSTGQHEYGLIADEVQKIYPDFVGMKDGKPEALNYTRMVSVLVKAVQELAQKVDSLSK